MEVVAASLSLIIVIVVLAIYFLRRILNYWKDQGIPHEEPHIVMGNIKGVRTTHHIAEILANYYKKFKGTGPFAGIYILQRPAVVLLDKALIKNVLIKDFNNFMDRGLYYNEKSDPLTGILFFLEGHKWKMLRNIQTPSFTLGKIKYMYPTLLKVADQFIGVLSADVETDPIVEVYEIISRYAIDIVTSCFFGIECNSLSNPKSEFPRLGLKGVRVQRHSGFIMALLDTFPKLARKLGMRILPEDVHQFFMSNIKDAIAYREEHQIQRNDLLNTLLELKNNKSDKLGLGGLSVEEICAHVFGLILGGFETASSVVTYALYELAQHHEIQERLRQEVNEVIENSPDSKITYDNLKNMTYMDQVLAETLLKYPVAGQLNRHALNDYVVPGHPKYVIKKGMLVFIPALGIHHDPEFYANPEEFDPERFAPEVAALRDPMEYMPFGLGPRSCIGKRFGQMESRLALVYLIRHFRFTTCFKTEIPIVYDPTALPYVPKNKIYLNLKKIKC